MKIKFLFALLCTLSLTSCNKLDNILNDNTTDDADNTAPPAISQDHIAAGVNWADGRDNFVDGWIIPSGLTASDDYTTVLKKSEKVLAGFKNNMQANTVRLGINPATVKDSWWDSYKGIIDAAVEKNMRVILACWEGASSKDGKIDDLSAFWKMWSKVTNQYKDVPNVYFEVFNEPHGYITTDLTSIYADWLSRYGNEFPKSRVLLGGTGYSSDVKPIATDSRFDGCLLSLHIYAWWGSYTNPDQWQNALKNGYGNYSDRTVLTEFGVPMTTGYDYNAAIDDNYEIAFLKGISTQLRKAHMSSCYWPGLRDGDTYSIQKRSGEGTNISLATTNESGLYRIQFGWGMGDSPFDSNAYYKVMNVKSGLALDVNQASTDGGASIIQWPFSSAANQFWQLVTVGKGNYEIINKNSALVLDVNQGATNDGANIIQWYANGGFNQRWKIIKLSNGYFKIENRNSGKVMGIKDASPDNAASVVQQTWNQGESQQWSIEIE